MQVLEHPSVVLVIYRMSDYMDPLRSIKLPTPKKNWDAASETPNAHADLSKVPPRAMHPFDFMSYVS